MSRWSSARARRVLSALERIGWKIKRASEPGAPFRISR